MNKLMTVVAILALATLAACCDETEIDVSPTDEASATSSADVELNDDGSVNTNASDAAK